MQKIFLDSCHRERFSTEGSGLFSDGSTIPAFFSSREKKKMCWRCAALRYNNLSSVRTIKISRVVHRFAVFTSSRIDFIFHIPLAGEGTIVRAISSECENGVTLLFRRRSYPPPRILLFTRDPARFFARLLILFTHWIYVRSSNSQYISQKTAIYPVFK